MSIFRPDPQLATQVARFIPDANGYLTPRLQNGGNSRGNSPCGSNDSRGSHRSAEAPEQPNGRAPGSPWGPEHARSVEVQPLYSDDAESISLQRAMTQPARRASQLTVSVEPAEHNDPQRPPTPDPRPQPTTYEEWNAFSPTTKRKLARPDPLQGRSIRIEGDRFVDEKGRTVQFRGINLGANSKMPTRPCGWTHRREDLSKFFNHKQVSFVGRPFPLSDAHEHFSRLQHWGYTLLRFIITWEAVEHAGPGIYDEEYLDYLYQVVDKARDYGFWVWIDPHQDVWSRFTAGSGAPGWTLEVVGFDLRKLEATGAAIVHQLRGDPYTHMLWPTNYTKLACATMFMLFYAGKELAPRTCVRGENIQDYLQRHYIKYVLKVATKLNDLPHVIGYGVMNEPNMGWIGIEDLSAYKWELQLGPCCSPLQSLAISAGMPQNVMVYDHGMLGFKNTGPAVVNPHGLRPWRDNMPCVWEANGVVRVRDGKLELLRPHHFARQRGRTINFYTDYFIPFAKRFSQAVHDVQPEAFIFVEDAPFSPPGMPHLHWDAADAAKEKIVCADHWYDGIPLVRKSYRSWLAWDGTEKKAQVGNKNATAARENGIRNIQYKAANYMGGRPVVVGETGIPLDMEDGKAFKTGDFRMQDEAMDGVLGALEVCFASSTIWCYNPDNNNARGDCWNGEDLSIFSRDQITGLGGLDDGGRAIKAAVRPHVRAFVGTPLAQRFSMYTREFVFSFTTSPESCPPSPKTPSSLRGWSPSNWDIRRALIPSSPSKSPERDKSSKVRTTARTGSPPSSESFRMSPSSGSSGVSGSGSGSGSVVPPPQLRPPPTQKPRRSDEHGKAGTPPVPEYMLGGEGGQAPIVFFVPRLHYGAKYEFSISDGYASKDPDNQLLHWVHDDTFPTHEIRIWNPAICIPNSVKEPSSGNRQKIRNAGGQMKDELSRFKQTTKGLLTKTSS